MRNLKLLISLLLVLIITSCKETLTEQASIRRIINETQYHIELKIFNEEELLFMINPFDTLNITGSCFHGVENWCNIGWSEHQFNEASVIFDNDKVLNYKPLDERAIQASPPTYFGGYTRTSEKNIDIYTYRILDADYDNAEPVDG